MIEQGRMTPIGLAKIEEAKRNGEWDKATQRENAANIPPDLKQALKANQQAQRNFDALAPSYKRQYIYWITDAKTDAMRRRRTKVAMKMLKENKKLGIDTRMGEWE